jgi:hypothetical protein
MASGQEERFYDPAWEIWAWDGKRFTLKETVIKAEDIPEHIKILAPEIGAVYEGMPREDLYKVFTDLQQKDYRKEGNEEWITFSDWTTEERGDLITFHLVDGRVEGWERHEKSKEIPEVKI